VKAPGFDATAACSSFVYAQYQAYLLVRAGLAKHVLVFGADDMPSAGDYTNRASFGLFGVGAAAYVISAVPLERDTFLYLDYGQDPEFIDVISSRVLPPSVPPHPDPSVNDGLRRVTMDGPAVFKHVVGPIRKRIQMMLDVTGIDPAEITVCPHQPNDRMTVATFEGFGFRRVIRNVIRTGNTTSAAVPLAFSEAYLEPLVDPTLPELLPGDYVFEPAFGGGLTWGFVLRQVSEDLCPARHIVWAPAAIADLMKMAVEIPAPTRETVWRSRLDPKPQAEAAAEA
jgi:3-oxoacyl-[acyl-carrier-protein] synthase-3